jgi:hypothetical protein
MDLNKDTRLTFDEFKEGSKQDPTIVQVGDSIPQVLLNRITLIIHKALSLYDGLV